MLIDNLNELFKRLLPDIDLIKSCWAERGLGTRLAELKSRVHAEEFWKDPENAMVSKQLKELEDLSKDVSGLSDVYQDLKEMLDRSTELSDEELEFINTELMDLQHKIKKLKIRILMDDEEDAANCYISINPGAGGTESQDWASMLLRMYLRYCEKNGLKADLIEYQGGEEAGIKGATIYVRGTNAYGKLKSEHGIHRLVRISPFDSNKRRHTSFASVFLTPEAPKSERIEILPSELRIDTYRASGAGGQHVNKTDSAVRITHIPTGIVVQCQNERSQTQNKETAMKMLMAKLVQRQKEDTAARLGKIEKKSNEWGSQIRSYVLHPYKLVKDHRTGIESHQPDLVLDGELIPFVEGFLVSGTKK